MADYPRGELRQCPTCIRAWPKGPDHGLRGLSWLGQLPRNVSPSNGDVFIHDDAHGIDRFLLIEIKMAWEYPPQLGQVKLLAAAAKQQNWTVRILRDEARKALLHTVTGRGITKVGHVVNLTAVAAAIRDFIDGRPWRDPDGPPSEWQEARCATCGAPPIGQFQDGSARWASDHIHPPFTLGPNGEHIPLLLP